MKHIYSFPNSNLLSGPKLFKILETTKLRDKLVRNYRRNFQIYLTKTPNFLKGFLRIS
jgi:hypothetical protein